MGIEYRWAEGRYDQLPAIVAELVRLEVTVIAATGGPPAALAAKAASTKIPIVFTMGGDPVRLGLVASLARPGGNITGHTNFSSNLEAKRLELLHELAPAATKFALLINPENPASESELLDAQAAAGAMDWQIHVLRASSDREIEIAIASLAEVRAGALSVSADAFFNTQRHQISALAVRHGVPAIAVTREFAVAGGLASYGANIPEGYRQAGVYVGRILKGAKPADLPVTQPTKFELVINLKTAKAIGLAISPTLLATADEVIE